MCVYPFFPLSNQVHYDGWSHMYDEWMDSDNGDLHPVGWCESTGHPLKVPPRESKIQQPPGKSLHTLYCIL